MVKELRSPAQLIAQNFIDGGFTMIDLASIGILFLDGKDAQDIAELVKEINSQDSENLSPKEIVGRALARSRVHKRKWNQTHPPSKSG